jgi:hypothetical protein
MIFEVGEVEEFKHNFVNIAVPKQVSYIFRGARQERPYRACKIAVPHETEKR